MKYLMMVALVAAMFVPAMANAEEIKSGLQAGERIGAFYVTKVAGADEDGVEQGEQLCYRCRYGSRPMVMVFARDTGGKLNDLVKEIDSAVEANQEAELKGLVTLLGEDASALKETAAKVVKTSGAKMVPVTVAKDNVAGPGNYKIDPNAAVTIVVANESKVVMAKKFKKADKLNVAAVMGTVKKMLN